MESFVPVSWMTLVPQPSGVLGLSSNPASEAEPGGVTGLSELHSAGDMLLLEGKKLGGQSACLGLSVPLQEGIPVRVLHSLSHGRPVSPLPKPDGARDSVFPRRVQLDLSQYSVVV